MKRYDLSLDGHYPHECLLNTLREDLIEAKFQKEKLEIHVQAYEDVEMSFALELVAILDFYEAGILKEFKIAKTLFKLVKEEVLADDILIIDTPTIIEKDVAKGALVILESPLFVVGSFEGTAVLRNPSATLYASNYNAAKVRTPLKDYYPLTYGAKEFTFYEAR